MDMDKINSNILKKAFAVHNSMHFTTFLLGHMQKLKFLDSINLAEKVTYVFSFFCLS